MKWQYKGHNPSKKETVIFFARILYINEDNVKGKCFIPEKIIILKIMNLSYCKL